MHILPQDKINNFEIGRAYLSMDRLKFMEYLLTMKDIISINGVSKLIRNIINEIKDSGKYAFWSHAKSLMPFSNGQADWDAYDYTKTDKYNSSEKVLFSMIGYNEIYHSSEVLMMYDQVKEALVYNIDTEINKLKVSLDNISDKEEKIEIKNKIRDLEKEKANALKNISLSSSYINGDTTVPEFVIDGKTYTPVYKDMLEKYQEFVKSHANELHNVPAEYISKGGDYALIQTSTPLFVAFCKDIANIEEIHNKTKQKSVEQLNSNEKDKEKISDTNKEQTVDKTSNMIKIDSIVQEYAAQENISKNIASDIELANGTQCKFRVFGQIVRQTDDKFVYVKIPDSKLHGIPFKKENVDLKNCIVKIPKMYANKIRDNEYEILLPMGENLKIQSPNGKDRLYKGKALYVKGYEIIKAFDIESITSSPKMLHEREADIVINGIPHLTDAKDGFVYVRTENEAKIIAGPKLGEVHIPDYVELDGKTYPVTGIETNAFANSEITVIKIPDTVKEIESSAFVNCKSLATVHLSNGLEAIGSSAFRDCEKLTEITIPTSVKSIGINPFEGCKALETINVAEDNSHFQDIEGMLISREGKLIAFPFTRVPKEIINIPDGITHIGQSVFKDRTDIKEISLPESCKTIEAQAFERSSIETVRSKSMDTIAIEDKAFSNADLKHLYLSTQNCNLSGNDIFVNTPYVQQNHIRSRKSYSRPKDFILNQKTDSQSLSNNKSQKRTKTKVINADIEH